MQSETMKAGREMDCEIARVVFGWTDVGNKQMYSSSGGDTINGPPMTFVPDGSEMRGTPPNERESSVPHYSTDIAAAWLVVERMRELGWHLTIDEWPWGRRGDDVWRAEFAFRDTLGSFAKEQAFASTAALAICLASLSARSAAHPAGGADGGCVK